MKITFIDQYSYLGGGQIILVTLIKSLGDKHKINIIFPRGGNLEKKIKKLKNNNIEFFNINENDFKYRKNNFFSILKVLKNNFLILFKYFDQIKSSDFLYCNGPRLFIFCAIASIFLKKKSNYHIHTKYNFYESLLISFISKFKSTNKIIFCSKYIFNNFNKNLISLNNMKISIIENGLSEEFYNEKYKNRFVLNNHPGLLKFAILGSLKPEKGQDIVFPLAKRFPEIDFYLIGKESKENREWIDSIKSQKSSNIFFQSELIDIKEFIDKNHINIFLVPSKWDEPFGLVAIEGMSLSCITIVSNKGGLVEIAKKTGALIYTKEIELIEKINNLKSIGEKKLAEISKNQFLKTKHFYSYKKFSEEIRKNIIN